MTTYKEWAAEARRTYGLVGNDDIDPMEAELRSAARDWWTSTGGYDPLVTVLPDGIPLTDDVVRTVERITGQQIGSERLPAGARILLRRWASYQEPC